MVFPRNRTTPFSSLQGCVVEPARSDGESGEVLPSCRPAEGVVEMMTTESEGIFLVFD